MPTTRINLIDGTRSGTFMVQLFEQALGEAATSITALTRRELKIRLRALGALGIHQALDLFDGDQPDIVAVSQQLQGAMDGHTLLVAPELGCIHWLRDLLGEKAQLRELTQLEEEALLELGNIIIGHCLTRLADRLDGRVGSLLPYLNRGHVSQLLQEFAEEIEQDRLFHCDLSLSTGTTDCAVALLWTRPGWDRNG